jgi:nucleoside-diphosphate-sugar epimerase
MEKVLVLGGTKFIGPCLVEQLVARGHEVAVFHRGQTQANLLPGVCHFLGDRHRLAEHTAELRRFAADVVVDMIALTEEDARSLLSTFRGIANRLVVLSSGDVYRAYGIFAGLEQGPVEPVPLTEDAPLRQALFIARAAAKNPADPMYHYEKIQVEQLVLSDPSLPGTVLRLPMVYGPGDYQHRLHTYLARMDAGRPVIPLDEGLARWRCLRGYVEDVAAAIALAATSAKATGRVYNVAEPIAHTEAEWVARIGAAAGWGGRVVTVPKGRLPVPFNTDQDLTMDSSRIRAELGYREVVPPAEALRKTIAWERANPAAQGLDFTADDSLIAELGL